MYERLGEEFGSKKEKARMQALSSLGLVRIGRHEQTDSMSIGDGTNKRVIPVTTEYLTLNPGTPLAQEVTAYVPSKKDLRALTGRRI